ncbi:MAG: DUF1570 domain-containing protein [Pirellulales bacterium]
MSKRSLCLIGFQITVAIISLSGLLTNADTLGSEWLKVDVRTSDSSRHVIEGLIKAEAVDGCVLLEQLDGELHLLQPDIIVSRRKIPPPPPFASPQEMGQAILGELPAGFNILTTKHYILCFNTRRQYAQWIAALFERLHDSFINYWGRAGCKIETPKQPLVVIIFSDRQEYEQYATGDLAAISNQVVGYYNLLTNRVTTFDLTGLESLRPFAQSNNFKSVNLLQHPAAAKLVATLIHEGTHQMAFNCGLHQRLAPIPLWVCEGVATYFETPDLATQRGWHAIGGVNHPRREQFLKRHKHGWLQHIVENDESFRHPDAAIEAYAQAWATTAFLMKTKKRLFVRYLGDLSTKEACQPDTKEQRIREFEQCFGTPDQNMEQDIAAFVTRMR